MLCGPPLALVNLITSPALMVSLFGTYLYVVPSSTILTSCVVPPAAGAAGPGVAGCSAAGVVVLGGVSAFFSPPPQAATPRASPAAKVVMRIADLPPKTWTLVFQPGHPPQWPAGDCEPFHKATLRRQSGNPNPAK